MASQWRGIVRGLPDPDQGGLTLADRIRAIAILNSMPDVQTYERIVDGLLDPNATLDEKVETVKAVLAAGAAGPSEAGSGAADKVELLEQKLNTVLAVVAPIWDAALVWRDTSIPSMNTRNVIDSWKKQVRNAYGCKCALLGTESLLVVAHILKKQHAAIARALGMEVWDVRNGMLLCKPLERAFYNSELCFYQDPDGHLRLHVLLPEIRMEKLAVSKFITKGEQEQLLAQEDRTFGDLEGKVLNLPAQADQQPFKRALSLHARQARKVAMRLGWMKDEDIWDFEDYSSINTLASNVMSWMQTACSEPEASASEHDSGEQA